MTRLSRPRAAQPVSMLARGSVLALGAAAAALSIVLSAPAAQAQPQDLGNGSYQFEFNGNAGAVAPVGGDGTGAWLTAVISPLMPSQDGREGVQIKLEGNLADDEFITSVGFNLANPDAISDISYSCDDGDACLNSKFRQDEDGIDFPNQLNGFDLAFEFPNGKPQGRFEGQDIVVITLIADGLTPESFLATNYPGGFYSAAKVQGISGGGSTTITDDAESAPGPLPLLGVLVAFSFSRRLRRRLLEQGGAAEQLNLKGGAPVLK